MGDNIPIDSDEYREEREYLEYPWPDDMEPLDHHDEFFVELCDLIEKYEEDEEERERYIRAVLEFGEVWLSNLHMTGNTW